MRAGYKNMRCGLIGEHLGHSFSKIIHAQIADYSYELVELEPDKVGDFVRSGGFDAFNVTIPYKKTVMPYLDEISPEAVRIGAVNTVVKGSDGKIYGYNTDYFGFDSMLRASGFDAEGKKAVILGKGGASLTVKTVLADRGASEIVVVSRGLEDNYENIGRHFDADLIVNATPVGMYPKNGESLISLGDFKNCKCVLDLIYNPSKTALLLEAEALQIPHMNGLHMLVAQAVKAYEFFTGDKADDNIIDSITQKIENDTQNIILIGMPGCGKSTVGKLLSEKLGRAFVDADERFSETYEMTPAEAITNFGEPRFRDMEHRVIAELGKCSGHVIACGGGVVTREENYAPLHQNGRIIYLKRELSRLATGGRPLSQKTSVEALYEARKDAYIRFADIVVESTEVPEKTADAMLASLGSKT